MKMIHEQYEETLKQNYELTKQNERLLAKLEIAAKALNRLAVAAPGEREKLVRHREQVAIEALKAIRE